MNRRLARLFVSNVSSKANLSELERLFAEYGRVSSFDITSTSGYVEYDNQKDANEAIKDLDGYKFSGKRLEVEYAVKATNRFVKKKKEQYQSDKESGRCFNCKEKGHIAKKCPHRRRDDSSSRSNSRSRSAKKSKKNNRKEDSSRSRSRSSKSKSKSKESSQSYSN